jgi:hypothetical protein
MLRSKYNKIDINEISMFIVPSSSTMGIEREITKRCFVSKDSRLSKNSIEVYKCIHIENGTNLHT